jgi:hypothetical protein
MGDERKKKVVVVWWSCVRSERGREEERSCFVQAAELARSSLHALARCSGDFEANPQL